jgi:hypothetical protein
MFFRQSEFKKKRNGVKVALLKTIMIPYLLTIPTFRNNVARDLRVRSRWKQRDRISDSIQREVIYVIIGELRHSYTTHFILPSFLKKKQVYKIIIRLCVCLYVCLAANFKILTNWPIFAILRMYIMPLERTFFKFLIINNTISTSFRTMKWYMIVGLGNVRSFLMWFFFSKIRNKSRLHKF